MPCHQGQIWEYFEEETVTQKVNDKDVEVNLARCKDCGKQFSMTSYSVELYVYDLSQGLAKSILPLLLNGKQIGGIWHTGIVIYGREYFFGGNGIQFVEPGGTILGHTYKVISMGTTEVPQDIFEEYLKELAESRFRPQDYHLLDHNCNTFSDETCNFLIGKNIPKYITDLPKEVKNSPIGSFLKPLLDQIYMSGSRMTSFADSSFSTVSVTDDGNAENLSLSASSEKDLNNSSASLLGQLGFLDDIFVPQPSQRQNMLETFENKSNKELEFSISKCIQEVDDLEELKNQFTACSDNEKMLIDEIFDYLASPGRWSISRVHINMLCNRIDLTTASESGYSRALSACRLLKAAMLNKETLPVIHHDPARSFFHLVEKFIEKSRKSEAIHEREKESEIVKTENFNSEERLLISTFTHCICNLLSHKEEGRLEQIFTVQDINAIVEFFVVSILSTNYNLVDSCCQSVSNLFLNWSKISSDSCFKLGIALFELLSGQRNSENNQLLDSVYPWLSFFHCLKADSEVKDFAIAMGMEGLLENIRHSTDVDDSSQVKKIKSFVEVVLLE